VPAPGRIPDLASSTSRARDIAAPESTGGHLRENYGSRTVVLADDQVARVSGIEERHRCVDPPSAPWD
jgi:hypothetical protein